MSWLLVSCMGQAPKKLNPTISIMQISIVSYVGLQLKIIFMTAFFDHYKYFVVQQSKTQRYSIYSDIKTESISSHFENRKQWSFNILSWNNDRNTTNNTKHITKRQHIQQTLYRTYRGSLRECMPAAVEYRYVNIDGICRICVTKRKWTEGRWEDGMD